ncbi:MAG: hypothetical protein ABRQ25_14635 [Clostridiaceae bacterium]
MEKMKKQNNVFLKHIIVPSIFTILFLINAALPKTVLGCANRGLVAISIAFTSIFAAVFTVLMALKKRKYNKDESTWWVISTFILIMPTIALLILA